MNPPIFLKTSLINNRPVCYEYCGGPFYLNFYISYVTQSIFKGQLLK